MENIKNVTIDGMEFQIQKMPTLDALNLDRKVATLALPIFAGLEDLHLDSESLNLDSMVKAIQETLINLDDKEWGSFILKMLSHVIYLPNGEENLEMTESVINTHFRGKLFTLYQLIFEVMKFEKFLPFEMVAGGKLTKRTNGLLKQEKVKKTTGKKLDKLELLKEN
jgi:hypothetical protein